MSLYTGSAGDGCHKTTVPAATSLQFLLYPAFMKKQSIICLLCVRYSTQKPILYERGTVR